MSGAGSISKEDNVENFPSNGNNCGRHFNNFRKEHHCRICNKVFKEISNFKTHLRTHSGERPYQCKSCPQKFKQMAHLQKHMFSHTGQKPYICRFQNCFKSFSTQYNMKVHSRLHSEEKPYSCKVCGATYNQLAHLKYHERNHFSEGTFNCNVCGKSYKSYLNLKKHDKKCNQNFVKIRKSSFESEIYRKEERHQIIGKEKRYYCNFCENTFTNFSDISEHRIVHSDESLYICDICGNVSNILMTKMLKSNAYKDEKRFQGESSETMFRKCNDQILSLNVPFHTRSGCVIGEKIKYEDSRFSNRNVLISAKSMESVKIWQPWN